MDGLSTRDHCMACACFGVRQVLASDTVLADDGLRHPPICAPAAVVAGADAYLLDVVGEGHIPPIGGTSSSHVGIDAL